MNDRLEIAARVMAAMRVGSFTPSATAMEVAVSAALNYADKLIALEETSRPPKSAPVVEKPRCAHGRFFDEPCEECGKNSCGHCGGTGFITLLAESGRGEDQRTACNVCQGSGKTKEELHDFPQVI